MIQRTFIVDTEEGEHELQLIFHTPEPDPRDGGDWQCRVVLEGAYEREWTIYGVDGLQAFQLAQSLAKSELQRLAGSAAMTWLGTAELGLG